MKHFVFDPDLHVGEIVLVGLGGTGSQWARSICRMLYDMRSRNLAIPRLRFVDPDVVEFKNVGRQMFASADVGRYKAEVLAKRFSAALGLEIIFHNEGFDPRKHLIRRYMQRGRSLICGAVDNHRARKKLAEADELWIDAGNHYSAGQVVIGNASKAHEVWDEIRYRLEHRPKLAELSDVIDIPRLPNAALLFPQLLKAERRKQADLSCADLVQLGEQHLLINDLIADVAAQYVYKLLHRQPITSFVTYVDADALNMRSVPITVDDLAAYIGAPKEMLEKEAIA